MPPSATDDWATPQQFYNGLNEIFQFDLDVVHLQRRVGT